MRSCEQNIGPNKCICVNHIKYYQQQYGDNNHRGKSSLPVKCAQHKWKLYAESISTYCSRYNENDYLVTMITPDMNKWVVTYHYLCKNVSPKTELYQETSQSCRPNTKFYLFMMSINEMEKFTVKCKRCIYPPKIREKKSTWKTVEVVLQTRNLIYIQGMAIWLPWLLQRRKNMNGDTQSSVYTCIVKNC